MIDAPDGGLVCSATWTTDVTLVVEPDGKINGTAESTMAQLGDCPHPAEEGGYTQIQQIHSSVTGTATAVQLQLNYVAIPPDVPADGIDSTGLTVAIFGFDTPQPPLVIPIVSPFRAAGSQQLQLTSGSNVYTSDNILDLTCDNC